MSNHLSSIPDNQLAHSYQTTKDESYFAEIFSRHYLSAKKFIKCIIQNETTAEDLTQETFIHLYTAFSKAQYEGKGFIAYYQRIAYNICLGHLKKEKRHCVDYIDGFDFPETETPVTLCELKEKNFVFASAAKKLTDCQKNVLLMRSYNLTHQKIGDLLGIKRGTVSNHMCKVKRNIISQAGVYAA